jgi:nicotinamidase-related amidase
MTDLCCETTARDAFMRGFKVYFVADATATATEERHLATLRAISTGFGEVISSRELLSRS